MIKLEELLGKIQDLPPMPAVAMQLMTAAGDPDADLSTVAGLIAKDPGMTATLLKLCNSSYYGFANKVSSIQQAASLFGLNKITQMAIVALSSKYLGGATKGYDLQSGELWKHSIIAAAAAEQLATVNGYSDKGMAFTAGLLQDIGKIIIHDHVGEKLSEIRHLAEEEKLGFMAAEKQVLGFSHAEAGALLMEKWNFPEALVDSVRYHHEPSLAKVDKRLAIISQVADALTMATGLGLGADGLCYNVPDENLAALGITDSLTIQQIIAAVVHKVGTDPDALSPPRAS